MQPKHYEPFISVVPISSICTIVQ